MGLNSFDGEVFSVWADTSGFIGSDRVNGLTAFYPADIGADGNDRPIRLTGLTQFSNEENKVVDKLANYQETGIVSLDPGDKFFSLTFALQDYASENTDYAWKFLQEDQGWNYQQTNTVRINGVPHGAHQLVIKARGSGGQWTSHHLKINIVAEPPLYLRLPFQALVTAVLGLLVWLFIRRRTRWLLREKSKLARMVNERTEELAHTNDELLEANRFRDRLFALISHDLRAPIISMRGLTRKVRYLVDNRRFDEVDKLADTVDGAVSSTQDLLDNLLAWAMGQAHEFPYHPEMIDLRTVLESNDKLFGTVADQKDVLLSTDVSEMVKVFADATAVATIIRNLTDNAIKFTPSGGTVNVFASVNGQLATVSVRDQGPGIDQMNIKEVFTLGRAGQGTGGEKGVGLGLPLSKELALANKGDLILARNGIDGATFTLSLPLRAN